jgi:type VI secretion system secreted protein VgrG
MDNYAMPPEKRPPNPLVWNIAAALVLLATLGLGIIFLGIFVNPASSLNPFPPPPAPTRLLFPTATITPLSLPSTWTPSPTVVPSETPTPRPTFTLEPTFTPFYLTPQEATSTPTETPTITPTATRTPTVTKTAQTTNTASPSPTGMPFAATVDYMASTTYHPDAGCNWLGVAGQTVDVNNSPILYLSIRLGGSLAGQPIDFRGLSATAPTYGASGFEFVLGNRPAASTQTLWIQLYDQQDVMPLTDKVYLDTFDDCAKNLIMVRFKKVQ